jgi:GTP cyclohydrolase I
MKEHFEALIQLLGEDLNREGLKRTPERAAKALQFLTQGYHQNLDNIINNALFHSDISELIIVRDIELYSLCEHHMLPFIGKCHIAYLPDGQVLGLSKIARIVDHFAQRLQIQENLTQQIAETILTTTKALGVGVIIEAKHLCMMMRGVEKQNSIMTTSVMLGALRDSATTRAEFLGLLKQ